MNQNNAVISAGVDLVNKSRQADVELKAQGLINQILNEKAKIALIEDSMKLERETHQKLGYDLLSQQDVLGTQWTGDLNMNQVTILKALEAHNKAKQERINLNSQVHTQRIEASKAKIEVHNKAIEGLKEQLNNLAIVPVTVSEVVG